MIVMIQMKDDDDLSKDAHIHVSIDQYNMSQIKSIKQQKNYASKIFTTK